jgi:p-cumate 2,3-dioxygenase beta subunit
VTGLGRAERGTAPGREVSLMAGKGDVVREIEEFLYNEAALLDDWRLDDWFELFTDDCRYIVPTTDLPEGDPEEDLVFVDDNWVTLRGRVNRLKSRHAHREYPSSRTRHLVTNVRLLEIREDEYRVAANFAVFRCRDASGRWSQTDVYMGSYDYVLKRQDATFKIKYKRANLDLEGLHGHGAVSILL